MNYYDLEQTTFHVTPEDLLSPVRCALGEQADLNMLTDGEPVDWTKIDWAEIDRASRQWLLRALGCTIEDLLEENNEENHDDQ